MADIPLKNGLNPPYRNVQLDNGVKPSAADYEEDYERRGDAPRTNTGKQGGDMGEKLSNKMNKKDNRHKEYR